MNTSQDKPVDFKPDVLCQGCNGYVCYRKALRWIKVVEGGMERLLSCFICERCTALRAIVFCYRLLWLITV
jgi:hypothetical protein